MKGKREGAGHRGGRHLAVRPRNGRAASARDRGVVRLVVCGAVFVLIVALKLLFPEAVSALAHGASQLIGQNADFREAFAAVGRAVSGEEPIRESLQDAYIAVFNPSEMSIGTMKTASPCAEPERPGAALARLTFAPLTGAEEGTELPGEAGNAPPESSVQTLTSSAVYIMPELPENASLELRNLGFSYTTPVDGHLSSAFGWRDHPTEGGTRFHYGIDLAAEIGTEIYAFADGEVFATGESSTLGKYIILLHEGGYKTLYAHCSAVVVTSGSVSMGQVIARVGESGTATGAHLHFELQDGSLYLNPIYYVSVG